jgi:hypothetical protein
VRKVLRPVGPATSDNHSRRSTFRDWAGECKDYPREVAEHAVAHLVGSKVERAYARSDLFEKRAALMNDWSEYLIA